MLRFALAVLLVVPALPALSQTEKEESCGYQADVVKAVQKARIDGVSQEDVQQVILESDPAWPDNFDNAIPDLAAFLYQQEKSVLKKYDFSEPYRETCLLKWEETQEMLQNLKE